MKKNAKGLFKVMGLTTVMGIGLMLSPSVSNANVTDMNDSHWAKEIVEQAISDGWVEDKGLFNPSKPITRIDAALYLGGAIGETEQNDFKPKFTDVNPGSKEYSYLANLTNKGVFADADKFNPNSTLTRAQAAKIIVEAFDLKGSSEQSFKDVSANSWYSSYVNTLVANKVTTGKTNVLFGPNDQVTRVQFVAFVDRALKLIPEKKVDLDSLETSPALFEAIMKNNGKTKEATLTMNVRSEDDLRKAAEMAYTELPKNIQLQTNLKLNDLKNMLYDWTQATYPNKTINNMTLANYKIEKRGSAVYLTDITHKNYNAVDIEKGVKQFAEEFNKRSTSSSDREKLLEAYEYIYKHYKYSANGSQEMLVGNMGSNTLACNGFSRLLYELTSAMGLKSEVVRGESHLWNRVTVDGKEMNVDVTTDIFLGKKYLTLGMNSQEHIATGGLVNIYDMKFNKSVYYDITTSYQEFMLENL